MKRFLLTLLFVVLIAGCGGGGGDVKSEVSPDEIADTLTAVEKLLYTDSYSGHLVVYFNEVLKLRVNGQRRLYSKSGESAIIDQIQSVLDAYPTAKIERSVSIDEDKLDALKEELEELSGKQLADFNSIYHIKVSDPDTAVQVMRALKDIGTVEKVYPGQKVSLDNLTTTPDLTSSHQGYLYSESTHGGLNAEAAWNAGIYGQNVELVAGDGGVNHGHLDLPLSIPGSTHGLGCTEINTDPICQNRVSHGTAVAGILAALDNGHGVTGFAPSSVFSMTGSSVDTPLALINGGYVNPGAVFVFNMRIVGPLNPNGVCGTTTYGCLPPPANSEAFDAIEYAIAAGITVVSTGGNGEISLDDPTAYYPDQRLLYQEDSGAIIVAASQGANKQIASFSNYGTPIDCFAWGQGVVTTGYDCNAPGKDCEIYSQWYGTTSPIPPNTDPNAYFIDAFGGTSASAPMVAGAAALVQSYAKQVMGETTRYIAPLKMREILVNSGVPQANGGGYIGMQPRIDIAMGMVDAEWVNWTTAFPQLLTNQPLTTTQRGDLNALGVGIICKDNDTAGSDPICPENDIWLPGSIIAETLDFDGDGRADLVQWSRGQFKIDLSGYAGDVDGFGSWDVFVNYPQINSDIVWPYVEDINSDERTDLVLYDKENGVWYISYTTSAVISGSGFQGWDHVISTNVNDTRDMDPWQSMYCRPHPGDYDSDGYVDLAVACSDGIWYIEHNPGITDPLTSSIVDWPASTSVVYDREVQYLTPTDMQGFPGWAFMTTTTDFLNWDQSDIVFKYPDGHTLAGSVVIKSPPNFSFDQLETVSVDFGGNEQILLLGKFVATMPSISIKRSDGRWLRSHPMDFYQSIEEPAPVGIYGSLDCHPITADYDGDGLVDHAVMCPDEWRIAYSGTDYPQFKNNQPFYRHIDALTYDTNEFTLPGRSYSGGVSYETTQQILEWYQAHYPNDPPPIPVDMVSVSACDLISGSECQ